MAISLSPLTGIPGVSNFGGYFGAFLKYAGFDALKVTGKASRETIIVIDGFKQEVSVEDAPDFEEVFDLEKALAERFVAAGYDKRHIAFMTTGIGAAHTTFGCINSHYYDVTKPVPGGSGIFRASRPVGPDSAPLCTTRKSGRSWCWLTYPHGENPYGAADWDKVRRAGATLHKVVKEVDPQSLKMYRKGSAGLITFMNKEEYQSLPVNNFQGGSDPRAAQICGKFYAENLFDHRGMDGCFPGCNLQCTKGGWVTLVSGAHAGMKVWVDGPEYETAAGFGSNLGIWNAEFIMEANWHCDNYGIDTITTATIMAFLMECFQRGYLTRDDGWPGTDLGQRGCSTGPSSTSWLTERRNWLGPPAKGCRTGGLGSRALHPENRHDPTGTGLIRHADQGAAVLLLPDASFALDAGFLRGSERHRGSSCGRLAHQGGSAGRFPQLRG